MRRNAVYLIATALLCLVAGFAAGFHWRGGEGSSPAVSPTPLADQSDGQPAETPAPLPVRPTVDAPPASRPTSETPNSESPDLELPAIPTGEHTVTVIVTDPDGNPVPGVVFAVQQDISALLVPQPRLGPNEDVADHEAHMQALARHRDFAERLQNAATVTKATDANGEIVFAGLATSNLWLKFHSSRYCMKGNTSSLRTRVSPDSVLRYVVFATAAFLVQVNATDIDQASGISVVCKPLGGEGVTHRTSVRLGVQSEVRLVAGRYSVQAASSTPRRFSASVEVEVVVGQQAPKVELDLAAPVGIYGKIHWEGGIANHVSVIGIRITGGLSDEDLLRESQHAIQKQIGVDAETQTFAWEAGDPGEYLIAVKSELRVLASKRVTFADVATDIELRIALPTDRPVLTLSIESHTGGAVPGVRIDTHAIGKNSHIQSEVWQADGKHLVVFGDGPETNRATRALVAAGTHELGRLYLEADTTISSSATLKFQRPCEPVITLKGLPTSITSRELRLVPQVAGTTPTEIHVEEASRKLGQVYVQPGRYRLLVRRYQEWFEFASVDLELVSGRQAIELEVPTLGTVKLDGSACQAGHHATLERSGTDKKLTIRFEQDRTCVVSLLPPGEYTIVYTNRGARSWSEPKRHTFTVPGNDVIVLPE